VGATAGAQPPLVAGVDGCRAGWVIVAGPAHPSTGRPGAARQESLQVTVVPEFAQLVAATGEAAVVALDMPIGLLTAARRGGRDCDRAARQALGKRGTSVFSPPVRGALEAATFAEALAANRASSDEQIGISLQSFHLIPKLRAVDAAMTPALQQRVREAHPELAFTIAHGQPLMHKKKRVAGRQERIAALRALGLAEPPLDERPSGVAADDLLDAWVLWWTAGRILRGEASRYGEPPARDGRGLRMEIWA
jgi:predicted RNase H-like nuclease